MVKLKKNERRRFAKASDRWNSPNTANIKVELLPIYQQLKSNWFAREGPFPKSELWRFVQPDAKSIDHNGSNLP